MFYTYAEKQGNIFFDGWQMRQVAFDTMRRYLYYSGGTLTESQIAYPNNEESAKLSRSSSDILDTPYNQSANTTTSTARDSRGATDSAGRPSPLMARSSSAGFGPTPPQPNLPHEVQWRKKIKVDLIVLVAKEHNFILEDSHLKETDLFQVEVHGELRPLALGEMPAPGPLLCPAAGLTGFPDRFKPDNEEFIRDPFFLRELYESLRDQFAYLRMERERQQMLSGQPLSAEARNPRIQTIQSPRAKGAPMFRNGRVKVVFRLRTEYEYRRFWYVVQTVLGYDKLSVRPYRGLPPYDPRNGLTFAQIPMCVWHTFKALDRAVFYIFLRGDLVGRTLKGELNIMLRGAYLCVTHDTVLVLRDTGNIPRWSRMQDVDYFFYNSKCRRPFLAFVSDTGAPDIVFIPQPPAFGEDAILRFNPTVEVERVKRVVHDTCLSSLEVRRVIKIREIKENSVRSFVEHEEAAGGPLRLNPAVGYVNPAECPLPKEQLAAVWREVQHIYASRDPTTVSHAAIPLYDNNTNDTAIAEAQLEVLARRLEYERSSTDDIVGISYAEAQRLRPPRRSSHSHLQRSTHGGARASTQEEVHQNLERARRTRPASSDRARELEARHDSGDEDNSIIDVLPPENTSSSAQPYPISSTPKTVLEGEPFGGSSVRSSYGQPGARYLTAEELQENGSFPASEVVAELHTEVTVQSPATAAQPSASNPLSPATACAPCHDGGSYNGSARGLSDAEYRDGFRSSIRNSPSLPNRRSGSNAAEPAAASTPHSQDCKAALET